MARLKKIKNNYYGLFYDRNRQPKEKAVPLRVSLKSAAADLLKRYEREYARGEFDPWETARTKRKPLTFTEATAAFLESRRADGLKRGSLKAYESCIRLFGDTLHAGALLTDVSGADVQRFLRAPAKPSKFHPNPPKAVSNSTAAHRYTHLRAFFSWAGENGHTKNSPIASIKAPKSGKKLAAFLSVQDVERLLAAIETDAELNGTPGSNQWLTDVILFAVGTGLRRKELCSIRWSDINLEHRFLSLRLYTDFTTKNDDERAIPLAGDALDVVRRRHEERADEMDAPIFTRPDGTALSGDYLYRQFKKYVRMAMLPDEIDVHSLRHTCASWLVMRGVPLRIVSAILGHSSVSVTERYSHLQPDTVRAYMDKAFGNGD